MMKSKKEIRKMLGIKKGGRLQINSHGAGKSSVLRIKDGKISEYNCDENALYVTTTAEIDAMNQRWATV